MQLITHSGKYHADDTFASAVLELVFKQSEVLRVHTVTEEMVQKSEHNQAIIYDIGDGQYDHHQNTNTKWHDEDQTKAFASFGLIWDQFGESYIQKLINDDLDSDTLSAIKDKVMTTLVTTIDASDNGFNFDNFGISGIINDIYALHPHEFHIAITMAKQILDARVQKAYNTIESQKTVRNSMQAISNEIIFLPINGAWKFLVKENFDLKFVIYQNNRDGRWNLQSAPICPETMTVRQLIPQELSTNPNVEFVHKAGFLAVIDTKEEAIAIAKKLTSKG